MIKHIVVYYIYWICLVILYLKKKQQKKNLTIEPLNVVTDVHVIFFYFKHHMSFKKWILDCSSYIPGVLGRPVQ